MPPGETAVINISGLTDSGFLGSILSSTASASSSSTETDSSTNSSTLNIGVTQLSDLDVDHDVSLEYNLPLDISAVFTTTITNNGPSDATGVSLSDVMPLGVTATDVVTTQGSCTLVVTCSLGTLEPGESVTVTVTADVGLGLLGSLLNSTVTATSSTPDSDTTNNSQTISVTI